MGIRLQAKGGSPEEELTSYYLKPRDWLLDQPLPDAHELGFIREELTNMDKKKVFAFLVIQ